MPRGDNPNSRKNLIPTNKRSKEEARKNSSKGGINSGKKRREKKTLRQCFEVLLENPITDKNGKTMSGAEALALAIFTKALKGNVRAFEATRDTSGQKPVDEIRDVTNTEICIDFGDLDNE